MLQLHRRHFLQFAGSTLGTIALPKNFFQLANQYGSALAQSSPRELALLVGINDYPSDIHSLNGCLTDVELQWELLVHRFGFNPRDILVLTDRPLSLPHSPHLKPTRQTILDAFEHHLIQAAKPGDRVVFHYSGHGSLVQDTSPNPWLKDVQGRGINGTLVPPDRTSPNASNTVRDITGHTLFLLMSALNTDYVTVVLDSCHSGGGTRGNLTVRSTPSRPDGTLATASPDELAYQARWQRQLNLSPDELAQRRKAGIAKGVAIGSAHYDQLAADVAFPGFHAGALTYLLTRYLWQRTRDEGLGTVFINLARSTKDVANTSGVTQEPIFDTNPVTHRDQPLYFLTPTAPAADAVIRGQKNGLIEFWLGGVSARTIATTETSYFTLLDPIGKPIGEIAQVARHGLIGYGKLQSGDPKTIQPGMLLREHVRSIPANLNLAIVLDASLKSDQAAAQEALRSVNRIVIVEETRSVQGNYRLGRVTEAIPLWGGFANAAAHPSLTVGSIGLFTADQRPLSQTFDRSGESVAEAITRLRSRLIALLAGQILQASLSDVHRLQVETTLLSDGPITPVNGIPQLRSGQTLQMKIHNREARNLYIAVLVIGATGNLTVLYPYWDAPDVAALIAAGETLVIPRSDDPVQFRLSGSSGFVEILVVASAQPLRDAVKTLGTIGQSRGLAARSPVPLHESEPLDIIEAFVGDLDRHSRAGARPVSGRAIDTTQLSAFSNVISISK